MKNKQILDQKQQKLTKEQQTSLMEQRYTVLQDLDNVLGIFAETAEIIKFFEEFPDHQMVTNAQNRLITQINLSNTIHFDQKDVDDPLLVGNLKDLKSLAKEYFEEIRQSIPFTDKIDHVADHYVKQNLNENNILQQLPGVLSNSKANFTPETIQNVFVAMNQVDTIMGKIRAGQNVEIPSKEEFQQKMQARQLNAQEKLKQNFKMEYEVSQKLKQKKGNQIKEEFDQKNKNQYQIDKEQDDEMEVEDEYGISQKNKMQIKNQVQKKQIQAQKRNTIDDKQQQKKEICNEKNRNKIVSKTASQKEQNQFNHSGKSVSQQQIQQLKKAQADQQEFQQQDANVKVIKYLKLLSKEIKLKVKMDDQKLQNIIQEMKKEIDVHVLKPIFQDIQNQFKDSELFKLFNLIIKDLQKNNKSTIRSTNINKALFLSEYIKKIDDYIKELETKKIQL